MPTIHCHFCGGFIADPAGITYREPDAASPPVVPHSALCKCEHSIVYGSAPAAELGGELVRDIHNIRSASRN